MQRVLLVGTGGFGRCWWPALAARADIEVVGIVEPDDGERTAAGEFFAVPAARRLRPGESDWAALGATAAIDSSPPWHHLGNATRAIDAGLDLLIAKPLAPTLHEARTIVALATERGRRIAVAQQMRYFPCFLALRRAIRNATAGRPLAIRLRMALDGRGWVPGTAWRLRMAHPLLLEAGIHHFDLIRWCLDREIAEISAVSWNPTWSPFDGDATVSAVLSTPDGVAIDYDATFAPGDAPAVRFDAGWEVVCEGGVLTVRDGGFFMDGTSVDVPSTSEPMPLETLNSAVLDVWLDACRRGVDAPFSGEDNLRSMAIVAQAIDSVQRRSGAGRSAIGVAAGVRA